MNERRALPPLSTHVLSLAHAFPAIAFNALTHSLSASAITPFSRRRRLTRCHTSHSAPRPLPPPPRPRPPPTAANRFPPPSLFTKRRRQRRRLRPARRRRRLRRRCARPRRGRPLPPPPRRRRRHRTRHLPHRDEINFYNLIIMSYDSLMHYLSSFPIIGIGFIIDLQEPQRN